MPRSNPNIGVSSIGMLAAGQEAAEAFYRVVDGTHDRKITSYPNGVTQTELVDQGGRVKQIEGTRRPAVLTAFACTYEDASDPEATPLRAAVTDHAGHTTAYDYDSLDRLSEAVTRDPSNTVVDHHAYGYDDAGNRTSWAHDGVTTAYTHNAASQMTVAGSRTLSYDGAGNQTGDSAGQQLSYNAAGQTTSARRDTASPLESYTYAGDTQLQRTAINATAVVNAAHGVVRIGAVGYTRTAEGTLVSLREGATRGYYLIDGLGSVAAVTDDAGQVTNHYHYDPYGATTPACPSNVCLPNPWQYTGAHHDEATGLYKIGHRYYQPHHGSWTQPDPLEHRTNPAKPSEAHPYGYVGCDPINFVDPSGLHLSCVAGWLGFGTGAGTMLAIGGTILAGAATGGAALAIAAGAAAGTAAGGAATVGAHC